MRSCIASDNLAPAGPLDGVIAGLVIVWMGRSPDPAERRRAGLRKWQRDYRKRNPAKARAREITKAAIKRGDLVKQPCADCGAAGPVDSHHHDYSKPLEVTWLCKPCHRKRHKRRRRGAEADSARTHPAVHVGEQG